MASAVTTGLWDRKRLWIGPALTAVVIVAVGWWTQMTVEDEARRILPGQLQALLDADIAALEIWLKGQQADAETLAGDDRIRRLTADLIAIAENPGSASLTADLLTSSALRDLRLTLESWLEEHQGQGFVILDSRFTVLAGDLDSGIGDASIAQSFSSVLEPVFRGETVFIPPFKSLMVLADIDGVARAGIPVMFTAVPIMDDAGTVIATLCLRSRPEDEFTKILGVARAGESGETYAFNRQGVMITNSRFDADLKSIGLLPNDDEIRSLLNVQLRDPGVDMTAFERPKDRRVDQPLTRMAQSAIAGESGFDVNGYRDYRGVPVIGAWRWLPEYEIGVATEVDVAEAFRPLYALRRAFGVLTGLLVATTLGMCLLAWYATRLERQARRAVLSARQLGQYSLDELLGEGGMGVVYRARHSMLHRPTAVKLLHVDTTSEQTIARFEREVQLTSQLTHPNTIAIYDYGRTGEGVFYYAMELLDGITLDDLVTRFGPQPEGRVIAILRQLCGSLSEAHGLGLIHRDIKPANIMLTRRGGMTDFVKLLDFGLVKPRDAERNMTLAGSLTGTPLYLPPEAVQHQELDARSDLYSVGAVAYNLLTAQPVFDGATILEICRQHVDEPPRAPSERLGKAIALDLERIVLQCLAKSPEDRPADAATLDALLATCESASAWTKAASDAWWAAHLPADGAVPPAAGSHNSSPEPHASKTIAMPGPG